MDTSEQAVAQQRAPRNQQRVDVGATRAPDRLAYLSLAVATGLFLFVGGRWNIAWAAWLAPLLLLHFVHSRRPVPGLLLAWLARSVVFAVVLPPILYPPGTAPAGAAPYVVAVLVGLLVTLPYVADRLIAPRLPGVAATLVFPAALTALEYLGSLGPFGAITSTAYTQYGNLPLMQLASVTGIWGITFVVAWFASVGNWAWRQGLAWPTVLTGALPCAVVLSLILLDGGARLALAPPDASTVRVAGISASRAAVAALNQQLPPRILSSLAPGTASPADRARARAAFTAIDDELLARSAEEGRGGAQIVVWPETSPTGAAVLQEDETTLLQRAGVIARQGGMYLDLGLAVFLNGPGAGPFARDEAVLLDPTGRVIWTYQKTHPTPADQGVFVLGDGKVPTTDSPYGRLANVICFDMDFPGMIRQAGQTGADLMIAPSDDWPAIDPSHTYVSAFRAIENGFSLVRQASQGLSMATDYEGRVLAASDYFTTDQQAIVAELPTRGVRTVYAAVGDVFAWLCLAGLAVLTGMAILQRRQPQAAAPTGVAVEEAQPQATPRAGALVDRER